jgi:hypothetical protein
VDPVPDPLLRKSGSAGIEPGPLDLNRRGGRIEASSKYNFSPISRFSYSSTVNMKAIDSPEMSVAFQRTANVIAQTIELKIEIVHIFVKLKNCLV